MSSAQRVLEQHIESYIGRKIEGLKPSPPDFHPVLQAFIRSGKLSKATDFIDKIQELHDAKQLPEGPNLPTYNVLLDAWKESTDPDKETRIKTLETRIEELCGKDDGETKDGPFEGNLGG